jgi:hypothetical protein
MWNEKVWLFKASNEITLDKSVNGNYDIALLQIFVLTLSKLLNELKEIIVILQEANVVESLIELNHLNLIVSFIQIDSIALQTDMDFNLFNDLICSWLCP